MFFTVQVSLTTVFTALTAAEDFGVDFQNLRHVFTIRLKAVIVLADLNHPVLAELDDGTL